MKVIYNIALGLILAGSAAAFAQSQGDVINPDGDSQSEGMSVDAAQCLGKGCFHNTYNGATPAMDHQKDEDFIQRMMDKNHPAPDKPPETTT